MGRWEIKDLPAGRYNLTASKGGYVQLNYGQRRPFERGRPLELADGQTLDNVNFNLPRGSVIAGRIVDEFGEPIADAMVSALHYRTFSGRRRLVPVGRFGSTDDMGHFRLYGLAPGDYYVSATLAADGHDGHRVERRQHDQLRADLLPGHRQRAAGRPHQRRPGRRDGGHHVLAAAGAHGEGHAARRWIRRASRWRARS